MTLTTLCSIPQPKRVVPLVHAARVQLHHRSHKIDSTLQGFASLFVAIETHIPLLAIISVLWAVLDFYCMFDRGEDLR